MAPRQRVKSDADAASIISRTGPLRWCQGWPGWRAPETVAGLLVGFGQMQRRPEAVR